MEAGFFPLDEELELYEEAGSLSPRLHEWLVRLSVWMPFEHAATLLSDFARVQVSEATTRRQTEAAGAAYEAIQTEEVERIERTLPPVPQGPGPARQPGSYSRWMELWCPCCMGNGRK